jgi:hypothetical protein
LTAVGQARWTGYRGMQLSHLIINLNATVDEIGDAFGIERSHLDFFEMRGDAADYGLVRVAEKIRMIEERAALPHCKVGHLTFVAIRLKLLCNRIEQTPITPAFEPNAFHELMLLRSRAEHLISEVKFV